MGASNAKTRMRQPPLTAVLVKAGGAEGDPRPVYTWEGRGDHVLTLVRSYTPSGGGAPRLVAILYGNRDRHWFLGVWDTGTGAFVGALEGPPQTQGFGSLFTYQRASNGHPRIAAVTYRGPLCIWDGDDLSLQHTIQTHPVEYSLTLLAVYKEPIGKWTRLVTR
jgi:hypothetical protein